MSFMIVRIAIVLSALCSVWVLSGCTASCEAVGRWQNGSSQACRDCLNANCGTQLFEAGLALLNRSVCTQTMTDAYNACRTRESDPNSAPTVCRCAYANASGTCLAKIDTYLQCAAANCDARCR